MSRKPISTPKISEYFKASKIVPKSVEPPKKQSEIFYEFCEIKEQQCKGRCLTQKAEIKKEILSVKEKKSKVEDAIKTCRAIISQKDSEIEQLKAKLPKSEEDAVQRELFDGFSHNFTNDQLIDLRSIQPSSRGDSRFVLNAAKYLYSTELERVKTKSVLGRKRASKNAAKEKMTPEKKLIMEKIFDERLKGLDINLLERTERAKNLNKLIKNAFGNISKSLESKSTEHEVCQRLDSDK